MSQTLHLRRPPGPEVRAPAVPAGQPPLKDGAEASRTDRDRRRTPSRASGAAPQDEGRSREPVVHPHGRA